MYLFLRFSLDKNEINRNNLGIYSSMKVAKKSFLLL